MDNAEPVDAPSLEAAAPRFSERPAIRTLARLAPWIVVIVAGGVRFARLAVPHAIIPLDETYYAKDAAAYLRHGVEEGFAVHPPVGKWMIAFGEWVFGNKPFGWRFSAAVAGTLCILLIFLIARRLWGTPFASIAATILLACDGLFFVQSRIAMLDIFLAFWILVSFWLLLEDRARTAPDHHGWRWWRIGSGVALGLAVSSKWSAAALIPMLIVIALAWDFQRALPSRLWRIRLVTILVGPVVIAGEFFVVHDPVFRVMGGLAIAALLGVWLFSEFTLRAPIAPASVPEETVPTDIEDGGGSDLVPGEVVAEQMDGAPAMLMGGDDAGSISAHHVRNVAAIVLTFAVIPPLVYLATYVPWFASTKRYVPPRCNVTTTDARGFTVSKPMAGMRFWLCYQREIYDYHKNLKATKDDGTPIHPYLSHAWSWPWIGRPAAHYFHQQHRGVVTYDSEILGSPNPVSWWPAFFGALPLLAWWSYRRDTTAALILAMFAPLYLPWLITTRPLFMFYMTPAVPFLTLALVHVLHRIVSARPRLTGVAAAYLTLAVMGFVFYYPVLSAYPISEGAWQARMLFGGSSKLTIRGDCLSKFMKIRCWI